MAYADYMYYLDSYLMGKEPIVPTADFPYWEKQARREIDARTFGAIQKNQALATDDVKDCTCAVAELLYKADNLAEQARKEGAAGPLASYSNDGESGTYDLKESPYTESGKRAEIQRLIYKYLGNTGLLYAGVRCRES